MFVLKLLPMEGVLFPPNPLSYLLKSFCALCVELSRHFCASLQSVGQRFVTSMVCITSFKPS
jgi:hypothetical protein